MNSTGSSSLAELEDERTRLRSECSMLFDKKRAIELQMEEIQSRLQWLDDKIDGTGIGEESEGLSGGGIKRKFALTMPTTQTQQDDESLVAAGTKVKFEVVDDEKNNGKKRSLGNNNSSISLTQPEEYLTDPHTQPSQQDQDRHSGDTNAEKARRISTSPHPPEMLQSKTPPGLKRSAAPAATLMNQAGEGADRRGGNVGANNANPFQDLIGTNPFQDLWSSNENTNHLTAQSATTSKARREVANPYCRGANGVNTLEKYLTRVKPANNPAIEIGTSNGGGKKLQSQNNVQHPWSDRMMHHLRNTFNLSQFRDHQHDIINATMCGQDVFVVMRTGGGKSLTYQLPAVVQVESRERKVTIVISPLISLIRDQEEQMNAMRPGSAIAFTSGMAGGTSEHARRWGLVRDPNAGVALVFVTPEKVAKSGKFKGELEKLQNQGRLGRFVIDECHCATQWGHDFRPDYTKLGILKHHFPNIPVLAVTATASERVRHDCAEILKLRKNYRFFRSTANRPNLNYSVKCKQDSKDGVAKDMVAFIKENHVGEAGIIYTFSKKEADDVANKLCDHGIVARSYHSDVQETRKNQIQRSWMRNETQVVVATIAFGLGINKPDVRFVLHHTLSKSLEAYYQESGRAGRDGKPANCVLYYSPKDVPRMLGMIHGEAGEPSFWAMARYGQAHGDDALCRHVILATLGEADNTMGQTLVNLRNNCTTAVRKQIGAHVQTVVKVVNALNMSGERCTINQVVSKWRSKAADDNFSFLKDNPPGNDLNKEECERVVVSLLLEDILHPDIVFNAYNTIVYIILGPKGIPMCQSSNPRVEVCLPIRPNQKQASSSKRAPTNPLAVTDENGWISTRLQNPYTKKTSKPKASKAASKSKGKGKAKTKTSKGKKVAKKKAARSKMPAIDIVEIDLDSSSSSSDEDDTIMARRTAASKRKKQKKVIAEDTSDDDSDYEFSD